MLFNSIPFILVFLPAVLIGYYVLRYFSLFRVSLGWLAVASLFFYAWWNPKYLLLLLTSIVLNFYLGKSIANSRYKRPLLIIGISGNLAAIAVYKYLGFFASTVAQLTGAEIAVPELLLPLAISFFTFQQIAYLVDTYRTGYAEEMFDRYLLFVSFFPQLIAGPIVHHKEVAHQFSLLSVRAGRIDQVSTGLFLFSIGLAKKVLIADNLAPFANPVFSAADSGAAPTFLEAWGGLSAYTFQLYFDFSGYADMAVGLAKLFGIDLPINFNSPYKSRSIIEFWRRWHMTLSHFLRDYLYIPLGGSRRGSRSLNLLATMLLGGLWHGAGWNFIIWGGLHGAFLIVNHQWLLLKTVIRSNLRVAYGGSFTENSAGSPAEKSSQPTHESVNRVARARTWYPSYLGTLFSATPGVIATFLAVSVAWAFFRAETIDGAISMLRGIFGLQGLVIPEKIYQIAPGFFSSFANASPGLALGSFPHIKGFAVIFIAMLLAFFAPNSNELAQWIRSRPGEPYQSQTRILLGLIAMTITGILFVVSLKIISTVPDSEFLYFNF